MFSMKRKSLPSSRAGKISKSIELPIFAKIIKNLGFSVDSKNVINCEVSKFSADLCRYFIYNSTEVSSFVESLIDFLERKDNLLNCLQSTFRDDEIVASQDSLLRIMLGVESLQFRIICYLLEALATKCDSDEQLMRLIISHIRWLPFVSRPNAVIEECFTVLDACSESIQSQIISCLPEIVVDEQHDELAKRLCTIYETSPNPLLPVILDALSNLNTNLSTITTVHDSVLKTMQSCDLNDLPLMVRFCFRTSEDNYVKSMILNLRKHLDFGVFVHECVKTRSVESILIETIEMELRFQKRFVSEWFNIMETEVCVLLDVLFLIVIYKFAFEKKVLNCFRQFAKQNNTFTKTVINLIQNHSQAIKPYFNTMLTIANCLLPAMTDSTAIKSLCVSLYEELFLRYNVFSKQEIVSNLMSFAALKNKGECALNILSFLTLKYCEDMKRFSAFFQNLLELVDRMSLLRIKEIFICLSWLSIDTNTLQEGNLQNVETYMIIKKYFFSINLYYNKIAVIGLIALISVLCEQFAKILENVKVLCDKNLCALVEEVMKYLRKNVILRALFYEELSFLLLETDLPPIFSDFLSKMAIEEFQNDYIVDVVDGAVHNPRQVLVESTLRYSIDDDVEIALNMSGTITNEFKSSFSKICSAHFLIYPLLRIICSLEIKMHNNIDEIIGVIGCPIHMFNNSTISNFELLKSSHRQFICASLLCLINWFRELLNCFTVPVAAHSKQLILLRLDDLSMLQKTFIEKAAQTASFTPVITDFYKIESFEQLQMNCVKSSLGQSTSTNISSIASSDEDLIEDSSSKSISINYDHVFRELCLKVFDYLQYPCNLIEGNLCDTQSHISLLSFNFLLTDLLGKLKFFKRQSFTLTRSKISLDGYRNLHRFGIQHFLMQIPTIVGNLCHALHNFLKYFAENSANEDVDDVSRCDNNVSSSFGLLVEVLINIFSISTLSSSNNVDILTSCLQKMASFINNIYLDQHNINELVNVCLSIAFKFEDFLPNLIIAEKIVLFCASLSSFSSDSKVLVADLAKRLLSKKFEFPSKNIAKVNDAIGVISLQYFSETPNVLIEIDTVFNNVIERLTSDSRNSSCVDFQVINKNNFPIFLKSAFTVLVKCIKKLHKSTYENLNSWLDAVKCLHIFVNCAKNFKSRVVFVTCLKNAKLFIECFLKEGMPIMDHWFRKENIIVLNLIKILQHSTKFLQNVCLHLKTSKTTGLLPYVPGLKKVLEALIFRVRAMLELNGCEIAFWIGNLKNRDLDGNFISSQCNEDDNSDSSVHSNSSVIDEEEKVSENY